MFGYYYDLEKKIHLVVDLRNIPTSQQFKQILTSVKTFGGKIPNRIA
jgi:hypothetical protein